MDLYETLFFQSISPGLVDTELLTKATDHEMVKFMPKLQPEDVADALKYIITRPQNVNVCCIIKNLYMYFFL